MQSRERGETLVRRALVTGAGRGIGLAIADRLAQAGYEVIIHAFTNSQLAEEASSKIINEGGRAVVMLGDLSEPHIIKQMMNNCPPVDILINNAAVAQEKPFETISSSDFDHMIAVNLRAPFLLIQRVLPHMIKQSWGRIVNISSIGGQWGGVNQIHYASAKAGLIGLTRSIAKTYGRVGVTSNAIAPGLVATEMSADELSRPDGRSKLETIPVGRICHPSEVASAALYLVSDEAAYVTGQTLNLNGGMLFS